MAREIRIPWSCAKTGDCCRAAQEVLVTPAERERLERVSTAPLTFVPHANRRFLRWLTPGGCPLLVDNQCSVWHDRPTTCRTFMCGRVEGEAYEGQATVPVLGMSGCKNADDRLRESRRWMDYTAAHLRRQKTWALAHGYTREDVAL